MNSLICKLGATGDVVRTTSLLRVLSGEVTWITASQNVSLLRGISANVRSFSWEDRRLAQDREYDLIVNLEDTQEVGLYAKSVEGKRRFGAYVDAEGAMRYTSDSRPWFDLSLISAYGPAQADKLKLQNRRTYQDLVFEGLGFGFKGEKYMLPKPPSTDLAGDVAIAPVAGPVWPMKGWAHYDQLKQKLETQGLRVNVLPKRETLLAHLGDVQNHRCLVAGDSLPMHLALGSNTQCVTLFNCTSPWEIYDYGLQTKIISPLLEEFFYKRTFDPRAIQAITLEDVYQAVMARCGHA